MICMMGKMWFALYCLYIVVLTACAGTTTAFGQINTGSIRGIIQDPSGARIPAASIQATEEQTGVVHATVSNHDGQYVFSLLPIGHYKIAAVAQGFTGLVQNGLALSAGQVLTLDLRLQLGSVTQTTTVSGAAIPLNYTGQEDLETLSNKQIEELPTATEDWSALLVLGNGIEARAGIDSDAVALNGLAPGAFSITVDGTNGQTDPEVPTIGFSGGFNVINNVNSAAISEITITKGIAPASSGAGMSGNINIITKGGTNEFHGNAFEYNNNAAFNARNQFLTSKPRSNFNEFGGSLGGPIMKDRLFFFGDYEGVKESSFQVVSGDVPTPQFVTQTLAVAPVYAPIFALFPAPNQPYSPGSVTGLYQAAGSLVQDDSNAVARLDYFLNPKNWLTLRVTRSRPFQGTPNVVINDGENYTGHNDTVNGQFTHASGNWTSSTRFGYNHLVQQRVSGLFGHSPDEVIYDGFDSNGTGNFNLFGSTYTWQEDAVISRGRHTIQFGGVFDLTRDGRIDGGTNSFQYSTLNDFLANIPDQIKINFALDQFQLHDFQFGGYIQDAYRIKSNLTLNVGLRYDYFTVPQEANGRIYTRDPSPLGPGTGPLRPPSQMYQSHWPNFSPRVGLSWSLGQDRKTVVRSGFGMFFNPHTIYGGPIDDVLNNPYVPLRLTLDRSQALTAGYNFPVNTAAVEAQLIASQAPVATTAIDDYFPNPYSIQWMLDIQRDLGHDFILDTGYVANHGLHLNINLTANLPDRLTGITPDPPFGQFRYYEAADDSNYNGWQTSLTKRFSRGLELGVNYTWSANFAFATGDIEEDNGTVQDNNNFRADYAPISARNNFNAHVVYLLPIQSWTHMTGFPARTLVDGWQVSSIFTALSGFPENVGNGNSSYPADRPDGVTGVNPYFSDYSRSNLQYLNSAAYAQVPISSASGAQIRPGDLSRNAVYGPGMWNVDLGLAKTFVLKERLNLQIRGDFFNAFNHTNLGGLDTNTSDSTFGQLTSATARTIQLGGRLTF